MFAAPKTANLPTDKITPTNDSPNVDPPIGASLGDEQNESKIIQTTDNPSSDEEPKQSTNEQNPENIVDKPTSADPKNEVIRKTKTTTEVAKNKEAKGFIGFKVPNEMKEELEDIAQEFAYLARKKYGLKIKDDSSSILRAFLKLGMSCFTEKLRHKTLQEFDPESTVEDEISQQLLAIMRIHKVEIDEIDF